MDKLFYSRIKLTFKSIPRMLLNKTSPLTDLINVTNTILQLLYLCYGILT